MSNQSAENGYGRELLTTGREKIKSLLARCKEYDDKRSDWQHLEEQRRQAQQLVLNFMNRTGKRARQARTVLKTINYRMQQLSKWLVSFRNDASFRDEVVATLKELRKVPQLHYVLPADDEIIEPCQALQLADAALEKLWQQWQSGPDRDTPEPPPAPAPAPSARTGVWASSWQNITITFLSDERVTIECNGTTVHETHNYGEMGFEDHRSGKPREAWIELREMSSKNGQPRDMDKKRAQQIRSLLKSHFSIDSDPLICHKSSGYSTRFQLLRSGSFNS